MVRQPEQFGRSIWVRGLQGGRDGSSTRWLWVQLLLRVSRRRAVVAQFTAGGSAWKNKSCWEAPMNKHSGQSIQLSTGAV